MSSTRRLEGEGEVFDGDASLGRATYLLFDTSTTRGRSAGGTLDFDDGAPRQIPVRPITIRLENGVSFQVVITRMVNGQVTIASHGAVPGL